MTTADRRADEPTISKQFLRAYRHSAFGLFAALAAVLAAFHFPGQMSVDSVMAIYEGATGAAVGWGPTFMAATIEWLGGGIVGTSLLVGIMCVLTYGCFATLLTRYSVRSVPFWQIVLGLILALNPLFMFYVGIVWKDVMLATAAMLAGTLLLLAAEQHGRIRHLMLALAAIVSGLLVPIRQQGILIAIPFAVVAAWLAARELELSKPLRAGVFAGYIVLVGACSVIFFAMSSATVTPQANGPVSVGIYAIQAYDIAGMIADARPGDPSKWSGASTKVQADIKAHYSSERIDTIWHEPVSNYFNGFSAERYMSVWLHGIAHNPWAYLKSRATAFAALLGLHDVKGCVPAYWGVSGLPKQMSALGLQEEMDARAHIIGRTAQDLYASPVFRNWFYALLLLAGTLQAVFRIQGGAKIAAGGIFIGAWLYWASFLPTTIACDFRYLYPVAALATVLCIFVLGHAPVLLRRDTANDKNDMGGRFAADRRRHG